MSDFEDLVRGVMRAHDDEAPTVDQFRGRDPLVAPRYNVRWLAVAAAAACVLAVVGVVVAVNRGGSHRDVAAPSRPSSNTPAGPSAVLTCPKTYGPTSIADQYWLPQQAHGVDAKSRLVPQERPGHVVVCGYLGADAALTRSRQLTGDLSIVPNTFSWLLPRSDAPSLACATNAGRHDGERYLFGVSYPDGTLWVSAPGNHCQGASNGRFVAADNLRTYASEALSTGTWQLSAPNSTDGCPALTTFGRLGQDAALVPGNPVSVQVCAYPSGSITSRGPVVVSPVIAGEELTSLVATLDALPTVRWDPMHATCPATHPSASDTYYVAIFKYSIGPPVSLNVESDCARAIVNWTLAATDTQGIALQRIQALLPR